MQILDQRQLSCYCCDWLIGCSSSLTVLQAATSNTVPIRSELLSWVLDQNS